MIDARQFDEEIVKPTLAEFGENFSCLRRAYLAVAVVDALAAHIYAQALDHDIDPINSFWVHSENSKEKTSDAAFKKRIAENCPGFRVVRDVAKANKHAILTMGKPLVDRSNQISSTPKAAAFGPLGEARPHGSDQIIVKTTRGEEIYLEHQILEAHETLNDFLDLIETYLDKPSDR